MKTVLAIGHIHFENLGIFEPFFEQQGFAVRYVEAPGADFNALDPLSARGRLAIASIILTSLGCRLCRTIEGRA